MTDFATPGLRKRAERIDSEGVKKYALFDKCACDGKEGR
jgi:hypothetical protein